MGLLQYCIHNDENRRPLDSRLAIHNADGVNGGQTSGLEFIDDKATFEDVAAWGISFDRLMKHKSKFFFRVVEFLGVFKVRYQGSRTFIRAPRADK